MLNNNCSAERGHEVMTETSGNAMNRNRAIAFCMLSAAFFLFFNLGGRTIENNDYPHFAEIGREILETGDWVIMHSGGEIYIDKPPLHTIFIALSIKLFGVNAFAGRVPAALFALIGVGATLLFGLRMDRQKWQTGVYGAMLLLSSYGFFFLARRFRNDIEYAMLFSLALFSFYEGYEALEPRSKWVFYGLFWLSMGLAALIKGPVALLPLLIIIVFVLVTKSWQQKAGGKIFLHRVPRFLSSWPRIWCCWWITRTFSHYVELLKNQTIMTRSEGLFYYIPVFFAKFFPGSLLLVACMPLFWKKRREIAANPRLLFLCIWSGLYLIVIHFIKAKVYRYLLPVFPALALITAWGIAQVLPVERWAPSGEAVLENTRRAYLSGLSCCHLREVGHVVAGPGARGRSFGHAGRGRRHNARLRCASVQPVCCLHAFHRRAADRPQQRGFNQSENLCNPAGKTDQGQ